MGADRLVAGIDLGSTRYRVGVLDATGRVLARREGSSAGAPTGTALVQTIASDTRAVIAAAGRGAVQLVGASICGAIDSASGEIYPPNLRSVWGMDFAAALRDAIGLPIVADNDANLGALAELRLGAGRGHHTIVYMTVSTGVGGGIVADGQILHGAHGLAGEVGHILVAPGGPRCGCGNYGCLEAVASGTGIARVARLRIAAGSPSFMIDMVDGDIERITAVTVAEAAARGDPLAIDVAREAGEALARGVLSLIHLVDPSLVILGGGVMESSDVFFPPVVAAVAANAYRPFTGRCQVVLAELGEDVCLIGAGQLALEAPTQARVIRAVP